MTLRGQVGIVTCVSTPHREQVEGQRSAGGREETRQVVCEGKVGARHLHAEQNTLQEGKQEAEIILLL